MTGAVAIVAICFFALLWMTDGRPNGPALAPAQEVILTIDPPRIVYVTQPPPMPDRNPLR